MSPSRIHTPSAPGPAMADTGPAARACPGGWTLAADAALSLHPVVASELRVVAGTLWLTLDGLHAGAREASGDQVVHAGEYASLPAGRHVVVQALAAAQPVCFDWQPADAVAALAVPLSAGRHQREWRIQVAEPLAELHAALAHAVNAAGRLAGGLGRYAIERVAGRAAPVGTEGRFDVEPGCRGAC